MSREVACIFRAEDCMEPWLIKSFTAVAFCALKKFGTSSEGNCNTELIRAEQVSNSGSWEGF